MLRRRPTCRPNGARGKLPGKPTCPARAASSPIVVGDKVIATSASGYRNDRLHVAAFDEATGKQLWHRQFWATGRTLTHPFSSVAANTPASDGQYVYAFFSLKRFGLPRPGRQSNLVPRHHPRLPDRGQRRRHVRFAGHRRRRGGRTGGERSQLHCDGTGQGDRQGVVESRSPEGHVLDVAGCLRSPMASRWYCCSQAST